MTKKPPTKADKDRYAALAQLGCMICGAEPQIHHVLKQKGMGRKNGNDMTYSLCFKHHTGNEGIHTIGRKTWEAKYGMEMVLLEKANLMLESQKLSKLFVAG